jgi:hypothetical protein
MFYNVHVNFDLAEHTMNFHTFAAQKLFFFLNQGLSRVSGPGGMPLLLLPSSLVDVDQMS